jgi:predicted  nucleic acid-binding Zn-ribbon protein
MEEQLSLLIELQEIDTRIRSLQEKKNKYPEALAALEQRRSESKADLEKTREGLQAAQKNKRDRDKDLEAGAAKVEKLKARTSEIKTNKEYQALLKEIETAEQENKAIEEDILVLMENIDAATAAIGGAEARALDEEAALAAEQQEHETALRAVEEELGSLTRQRQEKTAGMQAGLLAQYEKLARSKGVALAEARSEACSGCYMSIPPQVFVNVKKNESLINCPHCGRILYYKESITQK